MLKTLKQHSATWLLATGMLCGPLAAVAAEPAAPAAQVDPAAAKLFSPNTMEGRLASCTSCHGSQGKSGPDGYYPRIAGKPTEYLYNQLRSFRDGRRQYRPMQMLLENLSDDYLHQIAVWFSDQHPPYPAPIAAKIPAAELEHGRQLVMMGDPQRKIPACVACHGAALTGVKPAIPGLLGVPHDYISSQFGSWTNGLRKAVAPDCMAEIAKRMTPADMSAVASWLSSKPIEGVGLPAEPSDKPLPMECGSQPTVQGSAQ